MTSRDIFRLAIKLIGFIILLEGFRNIVESFMFMRGYAIVDQSTPQYWAAWAFIKLAAGTYLLVGMTPFVNLAFPPQAKGITVATQTTANSEKPDTAKHRMEPKAIFDIIVKTVGLIVFLYGLEYAVDSLIYAIRFPGPPDTATQRWGLFSVAEMGVGLAMLRGMVPVVDFAFPEKPTNAPPVVQEAETHDKRTDV